MGEKATTTTAREVNVCGEVTVETEIGWQKVETEIGWQKVDAGCVVSCVRAHACVCLVVSCCVWLSGVVLRSARVLDAAVCRGVL